jgi:tetratricopeptide (TPR) repeat protein
MKPWLPAALMVPALLAGLPSTSAPLPGRGDTWIRVRSEHLILIGNAGRRRTAKLAERLERFRDVLSRTSVNMTVKSTVPVVIYVFKNTKDFAPYRFGTAVAGYFVPAPEANYAALDASAGEQPYPVLYHEFVHLWLDQNLPGVPLWLNEGLAEFYSTFRIKAGSALGSSGTIEIGHPVMEHAYWLQRDKNFSVTRLLTRDPSSLDYDESRRTGQFYAQAWVLTHYLMMGSDGNARRLNDYLDRVTRGAPPLETYLEVFQTDTLTVNRTIRTYIDRGRYRYWTIPIDEKIAVEKPQVSEISYADALRSLADLLLHLRPHETDAAIEHLNEAETLEPGNPGVHATLARAYYRAQRPDEAEAEYGRAVALDPGRAETYWEGGVGLLEEYTTRDAWQVDSTAAEAFREARDRFSRAVELDPGNYAAKIGLGETYIYRGDVDSTAVELMGEAYRANPSQTAVLADWIALEGKLGRIDEAWDLLDTLLRPRGDAHAVRSTEYILAQAEVDEARRRLEDGDRDGALTRLQSIIRRTRNPYVREMATAWGMALFGEASYRGRINTYNEAVRQANAGNLDAALATLNGLLPTIEDRSLKASTEKLRQRLLAQQARHRQIEQYDQAARLVRSSKYDEAIAVLQKLLASHPGDSVREVAEKLLGMLENR